MARLGFSFAAVVGIVAFPLRVHAQSSACQRELVLDELTNECVSQLVLSERMIARSNLSRRDRAESAPRDFTARNVGIGLMVSGYTLSVASAIAGIASGGTGYAAAFLPVLGHPMAPLLDSSRTALSQPGGTFSAALVVPAVSAQVAGIALAAAFSAGFAIETQTGRVSVLPAPGGAVVGLRF